jgi:hypothetical protein
VTENTIAAFLAGHLAADKLRAELQTAETRVDSIMTEVSVLGMDSEFLVTRDMALRVCDSALAGELPAEGLRLLAFIIITSERFTWGNDELLAEILHDWSCPEVNYALTPENLLAIPTLARRNGDLSC